MSGFAGSSCTSTTPVFSLMVSTAFQVLPASVVLYSPRSPPGPHSGPSAATYTTFESRGSITTRPICSDFLSPRFCQLFPPSSDRQIPSPYPTLRCELLSPVPTHTTEESFGSSATQPIEYDPSPSNTGVQVVPSFTVFQTPPEATPT